ncbi:hypothetical protein BC830DRAFT_1137462 [Chytriomyces sp. MP71]|nr:hypothetical protein BC830DRAFT_1137462 [Chytriomyces sp. MP71]
MNGANGLMGYDSSPMLQLNMQLLPPGGIGLGGLGGPMVSTPLPVTPTGQLPGPVPLSQLPFQSHNMASHASLSPRLSSANLSVNVASLQSYAAAQGNTPTPTTHFTDISIEALLSPQAHSSSLNLNATDDLMNAILSPVLDTQSSVAGAFLFSPDLNPSYISSETTAFLDGALSPQIDIMSSLLSPALDFHAHPTTSSTDQDIISQLLSPLFSTTSMDPTGCMQFDAITAFNPLSPPTQLYTGGLGGLNPLSPGQCPNPLSPTTGDPFALDAFGILGGSLELGGAPPLPPALAGGPVRSAVQAQVRGSGVRAVPYDVGERRVGGAAGRSGNPGDAITSVAPPAVGSGIKTGGAAGKKRPFDHLIKRLRQQQQQQTGTTGGAVAVGPSGDSVGAVESVSDARRGISGTAHRGNSGEPSRVPEFGAVLLEYPADDLLLHFN